MLPPIEGLGLWILTDPESENEFQQIINRCSVTYPSETFLPHITISRVPDLSVDDLKDRVQKISKHLSPFLMDHEKIDCRIEPYQKICIQFTPNKSFKKLTEIIDQVFNGSYSKETDPHLSLMYSHVPCTKLNDLVDELKQHDFIKKPVKCQRLGLVHFSGTPSTWKLLYIQDLN